MCSIKQANLTTTFSNFSRDYSNHTHPLFDQLDHILSELMVDFMKMFGDLPVSLSVSTYNDVVETIDFEFTNGDIHTKVYIHLNDYVTDKTLCDLSVSNVLFEMGEGRMIVSTVTLETVSLMAALDRLDIINGVPVPDVDGVEDLLKSGLPLEISAIGE